MTLKNLWSLSIDEVLVADEIRNKLSKKKYEVFFPINAQLKDIDLILLALKTNKSKTIQVKGSRTWTPTRSERERYGAGSTSWFQIKKKAIFEPSNRVDFFIFVLHNLVEAKTKKEIKINYLVIPTARFKRLISNKKISKNELYNFFIWIDNKGKRAFDFHERNKRIFFSRYLDNWEMLKKT